MAGQANVYDLTRADEPTQEGTPLNKASLLTDAVAAAFGLGTSAVPNDALNILKKAVLAQVTGKYTKHTTIGEMPVGELFQVNINGVAKDFIVVQHGKPSDIYDDSCNGTWLLQLNGISLIQWTSNTRGNDYKNSTTNEYLNGDYLNSLDTEIRAAIKQVKIPYWDGTGLGGTAQNGANGLSCKVFILSLNEVGFDFATAGTGSKLEYFLSGEDTNANSRRRLYNESGGTVSCALRSPYVNDTAQVYFLEDTGAYGRGNVTASRYPRPAFILPSDYAYTFYTDEGGNVYTEQEYQTILTDVLGNEITAGARVEVGSYVGTGASGSDNPNTLSFSFRPKFVFIIQGNTDGSSNYWSVFVYGAPYGAGGRYYSSGFVMTSQATTWGNKSMSWYIYGAGTTSGVYDISGSFGYACQLNESRKKYYYVAIG